MAVGQTPGEWTWTRDLLRRGLAGEVEFFYGPGRHREGVPAGSGISPRDLLRQALESTLGIRAVREEREMEVLLLKRIGEGGPPRAEGDPALGSSVALGDNFTRGQYSELSGLAGWLERVTKKPMIDEIGPKDKYDCEFKIKSPKLADMNAALGKLALSLSAERRRVEVIVVRRKER